MKRPFEKKSKWICLVVCLLLLASAGSVLAEEGEPGLVVGEGMMTLPEGVVLPRAEPVRPSQEQSLMSWSTLLSEDFEGTFPGTSWITGSSFGGDYSWGKENYLSYSADYSVYPGGGGGQTYDPRDSYYPNDFTAWMLYANPFDLSTATEARFEFRVWMDTEPYNDNLYICASTDNSYYYCHIYSGSTDGWQVMSFDFSDWPYLGDLTGLSQVWIGFFFQVNETTNAQGIFIDDLVVRSTSSAAEPDMAAIFYRPQAGLYHPGDSFDSYAYFQNLGSADCPSYDVTEYLSTDPTITSGDIEISTANVIGPINPSEWGFSIMTPTIPDSTPAGLYYIGVMYSCLGDTETSNDTLVYANQIEVTAPGVAGIIFMDFFESRDFTSWNRYNPGKTGLTACSYGAVNGEYGACFYRPPGNDKRRQLIDETPVDQTSFSVRFYFDVNGLSMAEGERFRFMQVKMGQERPFLIVLKYQDGQYFIQVKTKLDDLSNLKTDWYLLTDELHAIEVDWQASSAPAANDGFIQLYLDTVLQEEITGIDSDSLYIDTLKIGYTSKMTGKSVSGTFFIDDVVTSNGGYIGLP